MKKFLAILMVLMLVLLPMTAFAAEGIASPTTFGSDNQGETNFKVEVNTSNISVTVPLNLVFVANANGGALTMPQNYAITNNSTLALKVTHISTGTLSTPQGAADAPTFSNEAQVANSAAKNVFQMTINAQNLSASMAQTAVSGTSWNITARDGETLGTLALPLAGTSSPLDFTADADSAATLFTVTYTIAPGINS